MYWFGQISLNNCFEYIIYSYCTLKNYIIYSYCTLKNVKKKNTKFWPNNAQEPTAKILCTKRLKNFVKPFFFWEIISGISNWLLVSNYNFLFLLFLKLDVFEFWYFKLWILLDKISKLAFTVEMLNIIEFIVIYQKLYIKSLHHRVAKI